VREVAHARKRNPLSDLNKILQGGRYPRRNHTCKFWWRSVKGFIGSGGSNLPFSIDFDRRPYNTLALPCEFVIVKYSPWAMRKRLNRSRCSLECWVEWVQRTTAAHLKTCLLFEMASCVTYSAVLLRFPGHGVTLPMRISTVRFSRLNARRVMARPLLMNMLSC